MSDEATIKQFFKSGKYKADVLKKCVDYEEYPCYAIVLNNDASMLGYCLVSEEGCAPFMRPYWDEDEAEKERVPKEFWDIEDANNRFIGKILDAMDSGQEIVDGVKWADYITKEI